MDPEHIKRLLLRIADKDELAFRELFNCYYPKLIHLALAFVPGIIAAQEVVSDLFYKILKNPKTLEKVNDFDNYIFLALRNQAFTYLRRNKHKTLIEPIDQKEDYILPDFRNPENSFISNELFVLVNKAIQELPPKRKVVFLMVKEEGRKYKEVAQYLDISVKTVEIQMSLALRKIREIVTEYQKSKDVKIKKIGGVNGLFNFFFSFFIILLIG